jgi:hypothetical protein
MTRTDRRGRPLKAFLQAEIAGVDVTIEEMRRACGLTRASYYGEPSGSGRGFDDSFPNSEELRQIAEFYKLGDNGWVSLLVEFGWLEPLPGTVLMPYTSEKPDQVVMPQIGLITLRDAVAHYQNAAVLVLSTDATEVTLAPVGQALHNDAEGYLVVFGATPVTGR